MVWEWFRGDYASWEEAAAQCPSYAAPAILDRVVNATRSVRDGTAAYERDGVAFAEPRVHERLLVVLRQAVVPARDLRVLDFGGGLGSLYWQHRAALDGVRPLRWRVVEQAHYVAAGRGEFTNGELSFEGQLGAACADGPPDLLLLSGVLQYLPAPWRALADLLATEPRWLFVDRLPLLDGARDRLTVEHVPPEIGAATYPAWFLSAARFLAALEPGYVREDAFVTTLENGAREEWTVFGATVANRGFLFRRRG